jgi:hypothetical protein
MGHADDIGFVEIAAVGVDGDAAIADGSVVRIVAYLSR